MQILLKILQLRRMVSPELRAEVRASIDALEERARKTTLPVDDLAVDVIKTLLTLIGLY